MFSGRISEAVAKQIEKKIAENNDLNALTDSELADLAKAFVGDSPPPHVPRETVIEILSQQPNIADWRTSLKQRAVEAAKQQVSSIAANVDPRMADMIKQQFGQWLQNSGLSSAEITTKIDTNSDGKITDGELRQFIHNLSGTNPPDWVSATLMSILDTDNNGSIEVQELWQYLGAIGFEVPTIETPKALEENSESVVEASYEQPKIDIDEELASIPETHTETDTEQDIATNTQPDASSSVSDEIPQQRSQETIDEVEIAPESSIDTSIEKGIERLYSTRLHRESVGVIESTDAAVCRLMVEKVERTLMVMDNYRGGMTAIGLLDGGPYTVSVLFEPVYNQQIEMMVGKSLTFTGALFDWSSGLRQAKLKATDPQF